MSMAIIKTTSTLMREMKLNKTYNEDCLETMARLPDEFVDLVVTSPPYDDLRTYNGYSFEFEKIAAELYRVIKTGGVVVWVVNDAIKDWSRTGTSFRQALHFMELGFKLPDTMIYARQAFMANRPDFYTAAFEYMFILSKGKPKTINIINDRPNRSFGSKKRYPDGNTTRNQDGTLRSKRRQVKEIQPFGRRINIWTYNTGHSHSSQDPLAFEHPAIFPEKLAADHIYSWSNPGDLVYDPFMGSGTTAKVAKAMGRKYLGSEISQKYCRIADKRTAQATLFAPPELKNPKNPDKPLDLMGQ